jgi:hypothetical protein
MRKINIQRDLESRRKMQPSIAPARELENTDETVKNKDNAESKVVSGNEDDTTASAGEKPKKRKRTSTGDVPALPV